MTSAWPLGPLYLTAKSRTLPPAPVPVRSPDGMTVVFASTCPALQLSELAVVPARSPTPPQMSQLPAAVELTTVTVATAAEGATLPSVPPRLVNALPGHAVTEAPGVPP